MSGAAIYIPQALNLKEIVKFVLSVLGLTWANVRQKLVKATSEEIVGGLEKVFGFVVTLVKDGPAAAWEQIKASLANLKDMVMQEIMSFVLRRVVESAIQKLVTGLNPAGAFIQAIIAVYNTIMFVVERLRQIGQVVAAFIDSISAIAAGNIGAAAARVETTMGGLLTLVISFLARLAGLGKVSDAVLNIVKKIRAPIDKAIDAVIKWIVTTAKKLFAALFKKKDKKDTRTDAQKQADLNKAMAEAQGLLGDKKKSVAKIKRKLSSIKSKYKMTSLELVVDSKDDKKATGHIQGVINPASSSPPATLEELVEAQCPINAAEYKGRDFVFKDPALAAKYSPLKFTSLGFPDFAPYAKANVKINMKGNRSYTLPDGDFGQANVKAGYKATHEHSDATWHHSEDRTTMLLVPRDLHQAVRHSGGCWVISKLGPLT
ncbi:MAG: HNH endonuclease [Acidobacteria bacterium]|nr:HNH endonuclease [Acidobacteriota bacterium]